MRLRFGLVGLVAASVAACSILVDSTGLTGAGSELPDATAAPDAGSDGAPLDAGADADEALPPPHPYVQAVLADGPALYYRLEETSDGPVKDEIGKYPGVYLSGGIHAVPGVFTGSTALLLMGRGGIDPGDIFDFDGVRPFTLEAWFLPEAYDTEYRFLFHHNDERERRQNYGIYIQVESGLGFERYIDGSGRGARTANPATGSWHHIVGVYDGERLALFVDGALVEALADNRAAKDKRSILMIGFGYNGGGALRGVLDEVAIYEKALDASQIEAHFKLAQ